RGGLEAGARLLSAWRRERPGPEGVRPRARSDATRTRSDLPATTKRRARPWAVAMVRTGTRRDRGTVTPTPPGRPSPHGTPARDTVDSTVETGAPGRRSD